MSCFRKFFVLLLLMFFPVTLLSSCKEKDTVYELNFMVDGEIYETIETLGCEEIILPEDPEKDGYVFDGWYADEEYEEPFLKDSLIDVILICDVNIYSKWIPNANQIVFNGNGATSGEMINQIINSGEIASLNENKFEKDLYDFVGWSTTQDGNVEYLDCDLYTMGTNSTYILYAVWEERIKFVSSVEDLKSIDNDLKNGIEYSKYVLKNDIAIEGEWNSIAIENSFDGCFDGCGYTITFKPTNMNYGLFKYNSGTIKNLLLKNEINITTTERLLFGSLVYENNGVISNCKISGTINISSSYRDGNNYAYIGGFVAYNNGLIKNSYSDAIIQARNEYDSVHCGGIAAETTGTIINCFTSGNLTGYVGSSYVLYYPCKVGGIAAAIDDGGRIINCFSVGTLKGATGSYTSAVSAIAYTGYSGISYTISNCYRTKQQILIADGKEHSHNVAGNPIVDDELTKVEFVAMQYLEFVSEDDLTNNENNVWILSENLLPTLYFESSEL